MRRGRRAPGVTTVGGGGTVRRSAGPRAPAPGTGPGRPGGRLRPVTCSSIGPARVVSQHKQFPRTVGTRENLLVPDSLPWRPQHSAPLCATGGTVSPRRPSGCRRADDVEPRGCGVRNCPSWPVSPPTTSPAWNRGAPRTPRRTSWKPWPGRCGSPRTNVPTSSTSPDLPTGGPAGCRDTSRRACTACWTASPAHPSPSSTRRGPSCWPIRSTWR